MPSWTGAARLRAWWRSMTMARRWAGSGWGRARTSSGCPGRGRSPSWRATTCGSINCFVVARTARRSGVASALLDAAVAYAAEHGAAILEGYPVDTRGTRISSASVYTGTAGMFRRAGFEVAAPDDLEGRLGNAARGDAPGTLALIPAAQPELCTGRSSRRADATNGAPTGQFVAPARVPGDARCARRATGCTHATGRPRHARGRPPSRTPTRPRARRYVVCRDSLRDDFDG